MLLEFTNNNSNNIPIGENINIELENNLPEELQPVVPQNRLSTRIRNPIDRHVAEPASGLLNNKIRGNKFIRNSFFLFILKIYIYKRKKNLGKL